MTSKFTLKRAVIAGALLLVGMGAMTGITSASPFKRMPAQAPSCSWAKLGGQSSQPVFFAAGAYDTQKNHFYYYGGISKDNTTQSAVQRIDVSDPDPSKATQQRLSVSGAQERYGASAAYWPPADATGMGKITFIGGANAQGDGQNDIQVLDIKGGSMSLTTPSGGLQRVFSVAAYDPDHKVAVVHGGTKKCKLIGRKKASPTPTPGISLNLGGVNGTEQSDTCVGDVLNTQFLKVDEASGTVSWMNGPSGGPNQLFGSTMAYDSDKKRMMVFGGVQDETKNPVKDLWALDLSNPDLTKASWSRMTVSGGPSARAFASSAYDAKNKWYVVYGGITGGFFSGKENVQDDTFALDVSGASPMWVDLKTSAGKRAGAVAGYAGNHQKVILAVGRQQFSDSGSQNVASDGRALACVAGAVPTATTMPGGKTATPGPTTPGGTKVPTVAPTLASGKVCDAIKSRVPSAVINAALANPSTVYGWNMPANPSLPTSPFNPLRTWLSLSNNAVPWSPANSVVWKAGCN